MPTSFEVLYLGNLPIIDTAEGNQSVNQGAVNSWLGTYGSASDPLATTDAVRDWAAVDFGGGGATVYDLDNNTSNDTFTVDGVQQTHDATMVFNATLTYFDGTTATITAVVTQATNGDTYLMPEFSANADQAAIDAAPIQSIELISPIYANGQPGRAYNLVADRVAADLVPCFTPGTLIATCRGEIAVEDLSEGTRIMTRDSGMQTIRWIGQRHVTGDDLAAHPQWQPIVIRAGALGAGVPETDLTVSPNHRILLTGERAELHFGESEVLVAAKFLTGLEGVDIQTANDVRYIHFVFDRHEVVLSNGAWSESFQPADYTLGALDAEGRAELEALFPGMGTGEASHWAAARRVLKAHEAQIFLG